MPWTLCTLRWSTLKFIVSSAWLSMVNWSSLKTFISSAWTSSIVFCLCRLLLSLIAVSDDVKLNLPLKSKRYVNLIAVKPDRLVQFQQFYKYKNHVYSMFNCTLTLPTRCFCESTNHIICYESQKVLLPHDEWHSNI